MTIDNEIVELSLGGIDPIMLDGPDPPVVFNYSIEQSCRFSVLIAEDSAESFGLRDGA